MSTPEQEQALATISSLATALRTQTLSDVQIDLLEVAAHLMTNIAVQTTLNCATTRLVEYQLGEPVWFLNRLGQEQRTTITNKCSIDSLEGPVTHYQTAFTGPSEWHIEQSLRKVEK